MKDELRFPLLGGKFLRPLDSRNWTIGEWVKKKKGEGLREVLVSYHPTLETAWKSCVDDNLLTAKTKKELGSIINQLKELKEPFFKENIK